jgi:tRNA-Thr(GGU) m(6)t(6)A37 methyltransferase TsaA
MRLKINDSYHISDITPEDKPAYLEHLKEKQIYDQTLSTPYPYTETHADWWINHNIEAAKTQDGQSLNWAIRRSQDDYLIGGIGFLGLKIGKNHTAEIGYWLAKPYWNKGIMTEAVKIASNYGFAELELTRITANVFHFNIGSARVLEKSEFQCEGYLRSHYKKDGKIFDGKLYAKVNPSQNTGISTPIFLKSIGTVQSTRTEPIDDQWDSVEASIVLDKDQFSEDAIAGLDTYSHIEVLYYMDQVSPDKLHTGSRHPRGNTDWPKVGIFAQRGKNRPNQIGSTICRVKSIKGHIIFVEGLDAIDRTPILDIKPFIKEFAARGEVHQPRWASELMKDYWK